VNGDGFGWGYAWLKLRLHRKGMVGKAHLGRRPLRIRAANIIPRTSEEPRRLLPYSGPRPNPPVAYAMPSANCPAECPPH